MPNDVNVIKGVNLGKIVTIIAGVHGNEVPGLRAIDKLIPTLKIKRGEVRFVVGNPKAVALGVRQTEMNLNRAFRPESELGDDEKGSYERQRALELMKILDSSDALLDLHSYSSQSDKSQPFIICEPHSFEIADQLPVKIISYGWDALEPGGTDYYMNKQGKIALCLECGYHLDPEAPKLAEVSIKIFLSKLGLIDDLRIDGKANKTLIKVNQIYITKENFIPASDFADFQPLAKGQLIGYDGREPIISKEASTIIFCRKREGRGEEAFLLGESSVPLID